MYQYYTTKRNEDREMTPHIFHYASDRTLRPEEVLRTVLQQKAPNRIFYNGYTSR